MDYGFIRVPRTLFKSAIWSTPRSFSTFEAYLDLLVLVYYRSYQYFHQGKYINLEPGDLLTTSSKLARRWGWEKEDVRKWLKHLANHRVLSAKVVDGLLKISLDPYCNSHFSQIPANLLPPAPGGKGGDLLSSSSEKEKEKNSSVLTSSENSENTEEGKTEESILKTSEEEKKKEEEKAKEETSSASEEQKNVEPENSARASAEEMADAIAKKVIGPVRPRFTANDLSENSQRLAELKQQCLPPRTDRTEFPPDFPMDEFRKYVDEAMKSKDRRIRPELHAGWLAELRDKFLAERTPPYSPPQAEGRATAATESSQPEDSRGGLRSSETLPDEKQAA